MGVGGLGVVVEVGVIRMVGLIVGVKCGNLFIIYFYCDFFVVSY